MKPKVLRKYYKKAYLLMRIKYKQEGFQIKEYLRLVYNNMIWEGKIKVSKNVFNSIFIDNFIQGMLK